MQVVDNESNGNHDQEDVNPGAKQHKFDLCTNRNLPAVGLLLPLLHRQLFRLDALELFSILVLLFLSE